jgi:myo-inositol-1(or 4)-monophosphatase
MFELSEIEDLANQVNLTILYEIAINSAQIGNEILKVNYNKIQKISSKGRKGDLITNVDLEVENKIKEYLLEETPNISINAEESGKLTKSSDLTWCIDPLDGTTNYSHGYPFFGTSIGLVYKNKPIIGAISVPYLNELYSACIGLGSFCNDNELKVSNPYLTHKTRGVRRGGAAAVDLAFVAAGKVDGYWERGLEVWDLAAGAIIVKEAGGIISDYPSGEFNLSSGRILACSPSLENELKNELDKVSPFKKNLYT